MTGRYLAAKFMVTQNKTQDWMADLAATNIPFDFIKDGHIPAARCVFITRSRPAASPGNFWFCDLHK